MHPQISNPVKRLVVFFGLLKHQEKERLQYQLISKELKKRYLKYFLS